MSHRLSLAACLLALAALGSAQDLPSRQPTPGLNLAAGKPCAFTPAPNYSYCTEAGDANQLTDGVYKGCNWVDQATVGWNVGRERVMFIDVDLGAAQPIGAITFDTITGGSQVTFPSAVLAFVSADGQTYRYLGDVMTESLPQDKGLNHRFVADGLQGWGRHVRLAVLAGGFYVFCDEIEVMRGDHTAGEARYLDDLPLPAEGVKAYAADLIPWATQKNATLTLLREAQAALDARAPLVGDRPLVATVARAIAEGREQALTDRSVRSPNYALGPPYRTADRRAFVGLARLNARLWPGKPVVTWRLPDNEWLHVGDGPVGKPDGAAVSADMMGNEWATASFAVTSASPQPQELTLVAADFTGPRGVAAADLLRLAHTVHVEGFGYNYRDDALVPVDEGPVVLQPGLSKRVWLTFKTRGLDLPPGTYASAVTVSAGGRVLATVPLRVRVWPLRFPDNVSLHSNTWGYFDEAPVVGRETAMAQDLLDHYNTALTVNNRYMPYPQPDAEGNFTQPLDFTKLDQMLAWNPDTRLWLLWPGFEFGRDRLGTPAFGTPVWEKVFTRWVTDIRDHLADKGIGKDRFAWYWMDEPGAEGFTERCVPASKLLKRIDPEMLTWENPTTGVSVQQLEEALPFFDMYCPNNNHITDQAAMDLFRRTRLPSWFYACASEKNSDPFGYYRWFAWKAWSMGLGGIGMWVYVDANNLTLSDYTTGVSYGLVYRGEKGIIGSKRWDAWRQGIADYEYLRMLREAVNASEKAGRSDAAVREAQALLTESVASIVGESPYGGDPAQAPAADALRLRILELLTELQ